jgi:perosamine synthetase
MPNLIPNEYWNYSFIDFVRGFASGLIGSREHRDIRIPGLGAAVPARSARAGLVLAMNALGLPPGSRVGVPLYCCPVVFKAIEAAACIPVFLDVDPETCCLSPRELDAKASQLKAVIAVHMFGNMCDMPALHEAARGRPIIEDCAQSLGSSLLGGLSGSFGAMSVFSFRSGKYLSVGEGGAIFTRDADIRARLERSATGLDAPGRFNECVHVSMTYLRSMLRRKPLYGWVGHRLWRTYNENVAFRSQTPVVLSRMYHTDISLSRRRLRTLESAIRAQRRNADYYSRHLAMDPRMLLSEQRGSSSNRYWYPLFFPSSRSRDAVAANLFQLGIGCSKPYKDIPEIAFSHFGYTGDCQVSEKIARTVLVIPSHHGLTEEEVSTVVDSVNKVWAKVSELAI